MALIGFEAFCEGGGERLGGAARLGPAGALLEASGGSVVGLLEGADALGSPPVSALLEIAERWRAFDRWRARAKASGLPSEVVALTRSPAQLEALEAIEARLGAGRVTGAVFEVMDAACRAALRDGSVRGEATAAAIAAAASDAQAAATVGSAGRFRPEEVQGPRWLAWRRAQQEGWLEVSFELPEGVALQQAQVRGGLAGEEAEEVAAAVEAAISGGLIEAELDARALGEALSEGGLAYRGLLTAPPLGVGSAAAIFVGAPRQPIGAARVDGEGRLVESVSIEDGPWWEERLGAWIGEQAVEGWVVPTSAVDRGRLGKVRGLLPKVPTVIKPAGLSAAREGVGGEGMAREVASAVVLARRALAPMAQWGAVDPVLLGLVEYQNDLDPGRLRAALEDVRAAALFERGRGAEVVHAAAVIGQRRLNPLVSSLPDLRPGMTLDVQVTNLVSFGAFVTFGLETEGLIHISELSERRLVSPSEVVRIGQQLKARVIEVDLKRQRVSLSLRPAPQEGRPRAGGGAKADAMAKLQQMFKK